MSSMRLNRLMMECMDWSWETIAMIEKSGLLDLTLPEMRVVLLDYEFCHEIREISSIEELEGGNILLKRIDGIKYWFDKDGKLFKQTDTFNEFFVETEVDYLGRLTAIRRYLPYSGVHGRTYKYENDLRYPIEVHEIETNTTYSAFACTGTADYDNMTLQLFHPVLGEKIYVVQNGLMRSMDQVAPDGSPFRGMVMGYSGDKLKYVEKIKKVMDVDLSLRYNLIHDESGKFESIEVVPLGK